MSAKGGSKRERPTTTTTECGTERGSYKVCVDCDALRANVDRTAQSFDDQCPFLHLEEFVRELARDDPALITRFDAIRKKRGAA